MRVMDKDTGSEAALLCGHAALLCHLFVGGERACWAKTADTNAPRERREEYSDMMVAERG